jgi:hypothetical protein
VVLIAALAREHGVKLPQCQTASLPHVSYSTGTLYALNILGHCIAGPAGVFGELVMRTQKNVSEDRLLKLMSEIVSLRRKLEQAERDRAASRVEVASAIVVAQAGLQSLSGRSL